MQSHKQSNDTSTDTVTNSSRVSRRDEFKKIDHRTEKHKTVITSDSRSKSTVSSATIATSSSSSSIRRKKSSIVDQVLTRGVNIVSR